MNTNSASGLTLEFAQKIVNTTVERAAAEGIELAIVVTDKSGHAVASARMDGVAFFALSIATRKAITSAGLGAPLDEIVKMASQDELVYTAFQSVPEVIFLPGATPIYFGGQCVGALGLSGSHHSQDQALANDVVQSILGS